MRNVNGNFNIHFPPSQFMAHADVSLFRFLVHLLDFGACQFNRRCLAVNKAAASTFAVSRTSRPTNERPTDRPNQNYISCFMYNFNARSLLSWIMQMNATKQDSFAHFSMISRRTHWDDVTSKLKSNLADAIDSILLVIRFYFIFFLRLHDERQTNCPSEMTFSALRPKQSSSL